MVQFKAEMITIRRNGAKAAKEAGMKYMVLTSKHHDGYCLWDKEQQEFNSMKLGPHRDLLKEFVGSGKRRRPESRSILFPADWSHPDYPVHICGIGPMYGRMKKREKTVCRFLYQPDKGSLLPVMGSWICSGMTAAFLSPLEGEE